MPGLQLNHVNERCRFCFQLCVSVGAIMAATVPSPTDVAVHQVSDHHFANSKEPLKHTAVTDLGWYQHCTASIE